MVRVAHSPHYIVYGVSNEGCLFTLHGYMPRQAPQCRSWFPPRATGKPAPTHRAKALPRHPTTEGTPSAPSPTPNPTVPIRKAPPGRPPSPSPLPLSMRIRKISSTNKQRIALTGLICAKEAPKRKHQRPCSTLGKGRRVRCMLSGWGNRRCPGRVKKCPPEETPGSVMGWSAGARPTVGTWRRAPRPREGDQFFRGFL